MLRGILVGAHAGKRHGKRAVASHDGDSVNGLERFQRRVHGRGRRIVSNRRGHLPIKQSRKVPLVKLLTFIV